MVALSKTSFSFIHCIDVRAHTKRPPHFWRGLLFVLLRVSGGAPTYGLLNDFGNHASADSTAAFADRKAQAVFHRDWCDQLNVELSPSRCPQAEQLYP